MQNRAILSLKTIILLNILPTFAYPTAPPPKPGPTLKHKEQFGKVPLKTGEGIKTQGGPDDEDAGLRPEGGSETEATDRRPRSPGELAGLSNDPCAEKHSIETFIRINNLRSPTAAPKGGVYYLSDLREVHQLFFQSAPNVPPEKLTSFPDGIRYYALSPDGDKILLGTQVGGDEQYDLHLFDVKAKSVRPLVVDRTKRIDSVAWARDSSWFAYTSNLRNKTDMDLYRYDLKSGSTSLLRELSGSNEVTDISPDGNLVALTNSRSIADEDVQIVDVKEKILRGVTPHDGKVSFRDGRFTADGKHLLFLSDREHGLHQLYSANLIGSFKPKILTNEKWTIDRYELDRNHTNLIYSTNEDGYSILHGYELTAAGNFRRPLLLPKDTKAILSSPTFAADTRPLTIFYARNTSTTATDIWSWQTPRGSRWTKSSDAALRSDCLSPEKLVHYPSFDKLSIPAFLYQPRGTSGPVPFIVYVHGGPEGQYRPGFSRLFQYFLERGYGVFAPNVRGSTGYGKSYASLDDYRKRMDSVTDAVTGAKWLIANGYSRAGELAIFGESYGGFMVLRSIEVEPNLFAAAAESVGIANFVTFLKNTKPYRRSLREVEYGPLTDEAFLKSISPMTYLDAIKTPLFLFHGANDPRVPVGEAEQVVNELRRRGVPVDVKIFPDEGHGNAKLVNVMEQAKLMTYFFEKHIRANEKRKGAPN